MLKFQVCGSFFAVAVALGSAAEAQTAAAPAASETDRDSGIQDIIVTANKRSENLQDVPIAITAVTSERLSGAGVTSTTDLAVVVPGLTIQNYNQAHLRGVGTSASGAGVENSIATYVDNVYMLSLTGALVQLSNIDQIEVLKGPQGTLYGRNATGGVINIRTRDPRHEASGSFSLGYGNYDTWSGRGYFTTGITENIAADFAGYFSLQGKGWGKNGFTGNEVKKADEYNVRSKWLFEPTDRDQIRVIGDYFHIKSSIFSAYTLLKGSSANYGPGTTLAGARPDLAPYVGPLPTQLSPIAVVGDPYLYDEGFYDVDLFVDPETNIKARGASLQWDHDFENLKITSITAYRRTTQHTDFSSNVSPAPRNTVALDTKAKQFSQEIQLGARDGAAVPWTIGAYYLSGDTHVDDITITGTALKPVYSIGYDSKVYTKSLAAFGQVTAPLWTGAHLTGGLRYTWEKRGIDAVQLVQFAPALPPTSLPPVVAHENFRKLTWRIALDQKLTTDILAYASYNRGFKSGMFNAVPPRRVAIKPEVLDAFEVGLKTDLFDRRLRFNISSYYYKYKNLQVTVFTTISANVQNGASAEVYGVDADVTAKPSDHLTLYGGVNLMHAEFKSYPSAPFFTPVPLAAGGGTIATTGSAAGNRLPYAPDYTFNVGGNYAAPIASGEINLNVNYSYSGKWFAGPDNILAQGAYGLLDASATYTLEDKGISIGMFARNITGEKYYASLNAAGNPGGYRQGLAGAPRTYGVKVGYKF